MTDTWSYQLEVIQQRPKPSPTVTVPLAAAIEALVENSLDMMKVIIQALIIASDTVVLPVSSQLSVELRKQDRFRQIAMGFTPFLKVG